jgi:hypothetical protein
LEAEVPEEYAGYQLNVKVYANTTPSITTTPILSRIVQTIFNPDHCNYDLGNFNLYLFGVNRVILVQGKIISQDNLPVGGAVVQLKNANGEILNQITSGVDGYYNLIACGQWLSSNEELTLTVSKRVFQEVTILTNAQQDLYHKDVKIAY